MTNPRAAMLHSQDDALVNLLQRLSKQRASGCAAILHLSRLQPRNRRPMHTRVALDGLDRFCERHDGRAFLLHNENVVVIAREATRAEIERMVDRMALLFSADPLSEDRDAFATHYDLAVELTMLMMEAEQAAREASMRRISAQTRLDVALRQPIDPTRLARLEQQAGRMDLSPFIRKQPICVVVQPNDAPQPILRELYMSIGELADRIAPDVDLFADQWLFQRFTQTLDCRMLSLLARQELGSVDGAISLNLNVSTILSSEFLAFDKARESLRGQIVIEMQTIDIFADFGAFAFARDLLRDRGYRVCLDGLTALTFPSIDRAQLGVDLVKLVWSPDFDPATGGGERFSQMRDWVQRTGRGRVILCRIDQPRGIERGAELGITLYQGRHLDALVQRTFEPEGPPPKLSFAPAAR